MAGSNNGIGKINRKTAKSGKLDYSDAVVIHETSRTRVQFVPFFINHSDHTELSIKIISLSKGKPPTEWQLVEDKSITLNEDAARKLLVGMESHLAVAEKKEGGEYIIIRLADGAPNLGDNNPADVANALVRVLGQSDIVGHLSGTEISSELSSALKGAIRIKEMKDSVSSLRHNLDNGVNSECVYQNWCDKHSWAFGNAYVMTDDVRDISTGDTVDMLLSNVIGGYRDIVELKRPDMKVLNYDNAHKNYYFSAEVAKAIGQCHRYLDVFHNEASKGLLDHPEIVAYHPRATIVIGRSSEWGEDKHKALHGLNRRFNNINVMTYDHLLAQGERLLSVVTPADGLDEGRRVYADS